MDRLLFVPSADELFLETEGERPGAAAAAAAVELRRRGWPTTARILGDGRSRQASGELIELVDALPVLALVGDDAAPTLRAWGAAARLGLTLVKGGRLRPRLWPRHVHAGDPRIAGWVARWVAAPDEAEAAAAAQIGDRLGPPEVALPIGRLAATAQLSGPPAPARLVRRFLDAVADVLVREAGWRGALVRPRGCPAGAWEVRLLRALTEVHAGLGVSDDDPPGLAEELNAWSRDEADGPPLLPSPPSWRAVEALEDVLRRVTAQAGQLARVLLSGHDAPRTLGALAAG